MMLLRRDCEDGAAMQMRLATLVLLHALTGISMMAGAQTKPNFSGTWTREDAEPERASVAATGDQAFRTGTPGSGWGSPITIRHDAKLLSVEYTHFAAYDLQPPLRFVYSLDGADSPNTWMIGHAQSTQHSRTAWRDDKLVITTVVDVPELRGNPRMEVRQVLTLESPETLVVETTRTGLAGAAASVTRTLYRRTGV